MSTLFGNHSTSNLFTPQQNSTAPTSLFSQSQNASSNPNIGSHQQSTTNNNSSNINQINANNINNPNGNPTWFQNPKKRIIPNHLVPKKKSGFQLSSSSQSASGNGNASSSSNSAGASSRKDAKSTASQSTTSNAFNLISFGSNVHRNASTSVGSLYDASISGDITKYDETINDTVHEDFSFYNAQEDLPPSRSIYDLNDDVLSSLNKPSKSHSDSFLNKDPKNFNSIFNKANVSSQADSKDKQDTSSTVPSLPSGSGSKLGSGNDNLSNTSGPSVDGGNHNSSLEPLNNGESAILVFGYPESMTNQVIQHFNGYGNILEDFEATRSKHPFANYYHQHTSSRDLDINNSNANNVVPMFTGHSWVKLTFDTPASAINALCENGSVFNGVLLGVVPYSKYTVEKLEKRKLNPEEDIGSGLDLSLYNSNPARNNSATATSNNEPNNAETVSDHASYNNRLDIKDGTGFFLYSKNTTDPSKSDAPKKGEKLGLLSSVSKYLFGINEL